MTSSTNHVNIGDDRRLPPGQYKKVFVQRDYSQGLTVQFVTKLPQELEGLVDERTFGQTITALNRFYEEAERVTSASFAETLLGCASCYLSQLCVKTQYEKALQKIAKFLKEQNEAVYAPRGLFITDPIERGLRVVEFTIQHPVQ